MKIVIISYYFPPCNSIASLRPLSWAKEWSSLGHEITVITRHWSEKDNNWNRFIASSDLRVTKRQTIDNYEVVYLPYSAYKYKTNRIQQKLNSLFRLLNGDFNYDIELKEFYSGVRNEIQSNKPELIIVSSPPLGLVKLGYKIASEFDVKLAVDFRDYENYSVLNQRAKLSCVSKIDLYIKNRYLNKWLKKADFVSVASKEFANYFAKNKITGSAIEYTNGYEPELFDSLKEVKSPFFMISIIGTILNNQDVTIFLKGFKEFLKRCDNKKVRVNFIGGKNIPEMASLWRGQIPSSILTVTERLDRSMAIQIGKDSTILFYPGWKNYKGMYSGKIFDYLALNKPILIAPSDHDVIEELVLHTQTGKVVDTSEEVMKCLLDWYQEWEKLGYVSHFGITKRVDQYSRRRIAKSMINKIDEAVN